MKAITTEYKSFLERLAKHEKLSPETFGFHLYTNLPLMVLMHLTSLPLSDMDIKAIRKLMFFQTRINLSNVRTNTIGTYKKSITVELDIA